MMALRRRVSRIDFDLALREAKVECTSHVPAPPALVEAATVYARARRTHRKLRRELVGLTEQRVAATRPVQKVSLAEQCRAVSFLVDAAEKDARFAADALLAEAARLR